MDLSATLWHQIEDTQIGSLVSLVLCSKDGEWISPITCQKFFPLGDVGTAGSCATFHCWEVQKICENGMVQISPSLGGKIVSHPELSQVDFLKVSELCAGIAGNSYGALRAGLEPVIAMDCSELACQIMQENFYPKVICGDVHALRDVARFHEGQEHVRTGLLVGFPCQPFSKLGSRKAFADSRAETFFRALDAAVLVQCSFLIMECVVGAKDHALVTQSLDRFCEVMGFQWTSTILRLDRALPSFRTRWWVLAIPKGVPLPQLRDLPLHPQRQQLQQIFSGWPKWNFMEELELAITEKEKDLYRGIDESLTIHRLNTCERAPTLLHSAAHLLTSCPCGCRKPFAQATLQTKGVHAILVHSEHPHIGLRHLHPAEAAFLVGMPAGIKHHGPTRELLPMLGQVASPIQAHWMVTLMLTSTQPNGDLIADERHEQEMLHFIQSHMSQWPLPVMSIPRALTLHFENEAPLRLVLKQAITARELSLHTQHLRRECGQLIFYGTAAKYEESSYIPVFEKELTAVRFGAGPSFDLEKQLESLSHIPPGLHELTMQREGQKLCDQAANPDFCFFSPFDLEHLETMRNASALQMIREQTGNCQNIVGIYWDKGHWILIHIIRQHDHLECVIYDGLLRVIPLGVDALVEKFKEAFGSSSHTMECCRHIIQKDGHHCGTVVLLHLGKILRLWSRIDDGTAQLWYQALHPKQFYTGSGGSREEAVLQWLTNFLPSKGVATQDAEARASLALKKIGLAPLERAIQSKDAWKALKQIGNSLGKPFQWITMNELEGHIQARTENKFGASGQVGKKKLRVNHKKEIQINLTPDALEIFPDTFEDENGESLPEVSIDAIRPDVRGVAITTPVHALTLMKDARNISTAAFGVVTVGPIHGVDDERLTAVQWTALYVPTQDPVIIRGHLLCLSDIKIQRTEPDDATEVPKLDTSVLKVQIFVDEYDQSWDALIRGPVKQLVAMIPSLQLCSDEDCSGQCSKFHAAVDESVRSVLCDVWHWRWLSTAGKPTKAPDAHSFSVYLRVPSSGVLAILQHSGVHGVYFEPRPTDPTLPRPTFSVVWLQKGATLQDAVRYRRTIDHIVGLARMGNKYGLRLNRKFESHVLQKVYPNRTMMTAPISSIYDMGPLPHGMGKEEICTMLSNWNWTARPLKPTRSSPTGRFWEIGASDAPPAPVLHSDQGDVAVSLKRDAKPQHVPIKVFQAPHKAVAHLKATKETTSKAIASTDPWQNGGDPWKNYAPMKQKVIPTVHAQPRLDEVENRLMAKIEEQIKTQTASTDVEMPDESTSKLQTQVQELQSQTQRFEGMFVNMGQRMATVEQTMTAQTGQIQELGQAVQACGSQTELIGKELGSLRQSFSVELSAAFENQNARMEALLEKRQRTEG